MEIRRIPLSRIHPAPYNPCVDLQPGNPEYEKIKRSLEEFELVDPLVWNERSGHLVGGHQRFKVLQAQGLTEVEVSVVDLPSEKEKALNLALNRIQGDWDKDRLAQLLDELCQLDDFDVGLTGFDTPEIDGYLDRLVLNDEDAFDLDAEVAFTGDPITKPGELIQLGSNRLLCGDSSDPESYRRLLDGRSVDLLFTDPPYNVDYYSGAKPKKKGARPRPTRAWRQIYHDNLTEEQYQAWLENILTQAFRFMKPGSPFYIWNGFRQFGPMGDMIERLEGHVGCVITWAKECFSFNYGDYHQQTEFCLYGWKKGSKHLWYGPANESTLWSVHREPTLSYEHPTPKPVALAQRAIKTVAVVVKSCWTVF